MLPITVFLIILGFELLEWGIRKMVDNLKEKAKDVLKENSNTLSPSTLEAKSALSEMESKLLEMKSEAEKLNNPSSFVAHSKLTRRIVKIEKEFQTATSNFQSLMTSEPTGPSEEAKSKANSFEKKAKFLSYAKIGILWVLRIFAFYYLQNFSHTFDQNCESLGGIKNWIGYSNPENTQFTVPCSPSIFILSFGVIGRLKLLFNL